MLGEGVDPPSAAGSLATEIASFVSLEACVKAHAAVDPLVAYGLHALGYRTFLMDACRILEAGHARSDEPCRRIDATGLAQECEAVVATRMGAADRCPLRVPGSPSLGRDPTCLAIATGDARLCAAEGSDGRLRCEAITLRDASRCGAASACARDVARWRDVSPAAPQRVPPPKIVAHLSVRERGSGAASVEAPLRSLVAQGVVEVKHGREISLAFGTARSLGVVPSASSPEMGLRVALALTLAEGSSPSLRHLEIDIPGKATLVVPPAQFVGTVAAARTAARGDAISVSLVGTISSVPHVYDVKLDMETFIVDVIDIDAQRLLDRADGERSP